MKAQTWEYMTLKIPTDRGFFSETNLNESILTEKLNFYGDQGWELVSVFGIEETRGGSIFVTAVLKRPKHLTEQS